MCYNESMEQQKQICAQCRSEKDLDDFYKNSVKANGHDAKCKECRKGKSKEYRGIHAKSIAKKRKEKYADNREEILVRKHAYYAKNRDKLLSEKTKYWKKNKTKIKERVTSWRSKNHSILKDKAKSYRSSISEAVLLLLGPTCKFCGETEKEFLTVDHIDDDGNSERQYGSIGWKRRILDGVFDSSKYRVLCQNCNLGRYRIDPIHHLDDKPEVGETRFCVVCSDTKDISKFSSQSSHSKRVCLSCRREKTIARRQEMIKMLGNGCACCGESEWYKLAIDHVKDDGSQKRKSGDRSGIDIMSAIIRGKLPRSDYQLLCWNCNHSKHRGNGLCIHQRSGTSFISGVSPTFRNQPSLVPVETVDFDLEAVKVGKPGPEDDCRAFFNAHHYAGFGRPSSILYVAKLNGDMIATAKFATPVRQGIAATVNVQNNQLLELDRFCIHPSYHKKNFPSHFMSRILKMLKKDRPDILKLVSFADPRFGHLGTIYQASNWEYVGKTARSYYYEDQKGLEINKKTLYEYAKSHKMIERQCAAVLGYKKVHTPPKIKFVYEL